MTKDERRNEKQNIRTLSIRRFWHRLRPNRKYKDRLFQLVFRDRKHLLDLYNAINHTSYEDPDALEITTLEDAIYLSMKNDLSFIISSTMNLYEHQSTFNPNMPIRGLMYFSRLYETYIADHDLDIFGRRLISLPSPRYIVFYNGREDQPDELHLKLSDAFLTEPPDADPPIPVLECTAHMLNINQGHNQELMEHCNRLMEYSHFIAQVNHNLDKGNDLRTAIQRAINHCIRNGILVDILKHSKGEVLDMLLTEYDEKKHMRHVYEEGLEDGFNNGFEKVNRLNLLLIESGREADILRATKDPAYQKQLLEEFHL